MLALMRKLVFWSMFAAKIEAGRGQRLLAKCYSSPEEEAGCGRSGLPAGYGGRVTGGLHIAGGGGRAGPEAVCHGKRRPGAASVPILPEEDYLAIRDNKWRVLNRQLKRFQEESSSSGSTKGPEHYP